MKQGWIALFAGCLFGAGLVLSGMADPAKVRGFLDVFGAWNPALAFVMAGALLPMAVAWRVQVLRVKPFAAPAFHLPQTRRIDASLVGGAILFGIGWGVAGFCPGPALADLARAPRPAAIFVLAMLAGMAVHMFWTRRLRASDAGSRNEMTEAAK